MAKTTWTANAMQIGFGILGIVEVNDHIDWQNIDTTSKQIGTNQAASLSTFEVMVNSTSAQISLTEYLQLNILKDNLPIAIRLLHAWMNEEAGVSELTNFFGQQFDTLSSVAENDGLRNF